MKKNLQMQHAERLRQELSFQWPSTPINLVLVEPEIPPNTGNIARLCAATASRLHLIEPLGFDLTDKSIRRAGLDYWDAVDITRYPDFATFLAQNTSGTKYLFSTSGAQNYTEASFCPGDYLIFGSESRGLPDKILTQFPGQILNIPILLDHVRSLNLSNCASIALYEALRQINAQKMDKKN
jgi:tRNA (cytidine/uridine-2'-O-)-methyltransferase